MTDIAKAPVAPPWLARKRHPFCFLCGRPSSHVNVYLPGKDTPVAPPPGKGRLFVYSLCTGCAERLDLLAETIEARIEDECRALGVVPARENGGVPAATPEAVGGHVTRNRAAKRDLAGREGSAQTRHVCAGSTISREVQQGRGQAPACGKPEGC